MPVTHHPLHGWDVAPDEVIRLQRPLFPQAGGRSEPSADAHFFLGERGKKALVRAM